MTDEKGLAMTVEMGARNDDKKGLAMTPPVIARKSVT